MSILSNPNDEFQLLEQITDQHPRTFSEKVIKYPKATNFHNCSKNRYDNVLPKEETRVCLSQIEQIPDSDYINANHVALNGSSYICSQAPLPATFFDFWRMVWEQEVSIIIMLTELLCPLGKVKAHRYWPSELGSTLIFGFLGIKLLEEKQERSLIIRKFRLTYDHNGQQEHRFLTQIQYNGWPDFSAPSIDEFKKLLALTEKHKDKSMSSTGTKRPMLVHCSAGVGRTGVFVAGRTLFKLAKEGVRLPSFHVVKALREQRTGMVQTPEQYLFLHSLSTSLARSQHYRDSSLSQSCFEQNFSCSGIMSTCG
eukprot:TRINITY_DN2001_c0_g1_i1.p1 TRINITY_DN2001_c0_g1~~TRINITY_DN2001_c0_g1_i1.p1  ORF type:complete len:311 (+),score=22.54 TRINITY_DN2001_c0_g1_i1:104-1036(+)